MMTSVLYQDIKTKIKGQCAVLSLFRYYWNEIEVSLCTPTSKVYQPVDYFVIIDTLTQLLNMQHIFSRICTNKRPLLLQSDLIT